MNLNSPGGYSAYQRLDAAFRTGNIADLEQELGTHADFPNVVAHPAMGLCLINAIYHSPTRFIRELLDRGADPSRGEGDGYPPLIAALSCLESSAGTAARTDVYEIVELLLAHGADIGQRGINDYSALHMAAAVGHLPLVDLLLAHGADPNAITHIDDYETPAEVAAAAGHDDVVERLRPLTDRLDWERGAREGDVGVLQTMVREGRDINSLDGYGMTALMRSAHAGHYESVAWLIANGADLNHTSKFGLSALMLSVIAGHHEITRLLVRAGADTTITGTGPPGFAGKTAADLAEDRDDSRLARYIRDSAPVDPG